MSVEAAAIMTFSFPGPPYEHSILLKFFDNHLCPFTNECVADSTAATISIIYSATETTSSTTMTSQLGSNPISFTNSAEPYYTVADL